VELFCGVSLSSDMACTKAVLFKNFRTDCFVCVVMVSGKHAVEGSAAKHYLLHQ
jgi:hypothetical protein